ncbi:hypothetical protein [Halocella sp. SP3-1]|uniref:hypothetical protein n=1 Tax=Halocella sp. SP3-1 TaxID=2382161 RepID=UPI000F75892E|nr:hypothetical protein [Halocella sp. SP3-1]AZO96080.1 hypothetical protein D7D81_16610 [Halocella sp. SP3-1]
MQDNEGNKIDIALMVEKLLGAGVKFRMSGTYQQLQDTWEDTVTIPTEQEIEDAWVDYQEELANYVPPATSEERITDLENAITDILGGAGSV